MKTLISIGSVAIGSIALNLIPVQQAQAVTLLNGNFTPVTATTVTKAFGDVGAFDTTSMGTGASASWTSEGYNFIVPTGNAVINPTGTGAITFAGTTGLTAPNGAGYYIAADGAYHAGRISQNLTGLVVGQTYSIDFYQAAAQQLGAATYNTATTDNWIVNVGGTYTTPTYDGAGESNGTGGFTGGTTRSSPVMSLAVQGAAGSQTTTTGNAKVNGWQQDSFAFTATSTSARLSFLARGGPTGKPPFALLAGVSARQIPEPDTYLGTLVGLSCLGLFVKSQLAKKKLDE
jgi:hypothetical protein